MTGNNQYYPTHFTKSAVTIVMHGLNVRPLAMLSIIKWLNNQGSDVYLIVLSGHKSNTDDFKEVTSAKWQKEITAGYQIAKQASIEASVPLYFLGYSLGALLGQTMIALAVKNLSFHKQVLIAPAIAIRPRAYLLKLLFSFGMHLKMPSYTPKEYRVHNFLPIRVYKILFSEEKKLIEASFKGLNIPTIVLIDPKDELISYRKLIRLIKRFRLTNYEIIVLDSGSKNKGTSYHHLIINESTMGLENWKVATRIFKKFLFEQMI